MSRGVQERAQDARPCIIERGFEFALWHALIIRDGFQGYNHGTVGEIAFCDNLACAREHHRETRRENRFLGVRIELPFRVATARRYDAQAVAQPSGIPERLS